MEHTRKYVSLESIVDLYMDQSETPQSGKFRLWNIARRGLEHISMELSLFPITAKIGVLPNKTVELPGDYYKWIKLGVINSNGEVATLRYNDYLTTYASQYDDRLSSIQSSVRLEQDGVYAEVYRNFIYDGVSYSLFGIPAGTTEFGSFSVDDKNGLIILSPDYEFDHVILEYASVPNEDSNFMVPTEYTEALIEWIAWKDIEFRPTGRRSNISEKELRKRNFRSMKRQAVNMASDVKLYVLTEIIRRGNRLSIKA